MRLLALLLLALALPAAALADERTLPWYGGSNVETEAERLLGDVASTVAGRRVSVRCNGEHDWNLLVGENSISRLGYVAFRGTTPLDYTELSPRVCWYLDQYAIASPKPAYWCQKQERYVERVVKKVRVKKRVAVKKGGKVVHRVVSRVVEKTVPVTRTRTVQVKCAGADEWWWYAESLHTLAHESVHLRGVRDELEAECTGLQFVERAALALGATAEEARTMAEQAAFAYESRRQPGYWSADCRSDGARDLSPGDGVWP